MKATKLAIPEVILFEPTVFGDDRGEFFESFNAKEFAEHTGLARTFVQSNHSRSSRGVLRGLHYQKGAHAQGKLVRVVAGMVWDVAVDIRKDSPTCGQYVGEYLSANNHRQLWVPEGFAHGFITITDTAEFLYNTTEFYAPQAEGCIAWDDPILDIQWPMPTKNNVEVELSEKDKVGQSFIEYLNNAAVLESA